MAHFIWKSRYEVSHGFGDSESELVLTEQDSGEDFSAGLQVSAFPFSVQVCGPRTLSFVFSKGTDLNRLESHHHIFIHLWKCCLRMHLIYHGTSFSLCSLPKYNVTQSITSELHELEGKPLLPHRVHFCHHLFLTSMLWVRYMSYAAGESLWFGEHRSLDLEGGRSEV